MKSSKVLRLSGSQFGPKQPNFVHKAAPDVRGSAEASSKWPQDSTGQRKTIWASKEIGDWNLASAAFGHLYDGVKLSCDRPSIAMFATAPRCKWREKKFFCQKNWGNAQLRRKQPIFFPQLYLQQLFQYEQIVPDRYSLAFEQLMIKGLSN